MSGDGLFPEIPKGDPGSIATAATGLGRVSGQLVSATGGLAAAAGGMQWSGYAQQRFHGATNQLTQVMGNASETFADLALATARYADALDKAQRELKRLATMYADARSAAASARSAAQSLASTQASTIDPDQHASLGADITRLGNQAGGHDADADAIARRAQNERDEFDQAAKAAANAFNGHPTAGHGPNLGPAANPFHGPGSTPGVTAPLGPHTGGAFGIPTGGLGGMDGVLHVDDPETRQTIGYGRYADQQEFAKNNMEVGDLTTAVTFAAGGIELAVGRVVVEGVIGAARATATRTMENAVSKPITRSIIEGATPKESIVARGARGAAKPAPKPVDSPPSATSVPAPGPAVEGEDAKAAADFTRARLARNGKITETATDVAGKVNLPVGPYAQLAGHIVENSDIYIPYGRVQVSSAIEKARRAAELVKRVLQR
jgi:hypothetical protein